MNEGINGINGDPQYDTIFQSIEYHDSIRSDGFHIYT